MIKCDTQSKAETALEELKRDWKVPFCPLSIGLCNNKCVCFYGARIVKVTDLMWHVYPTCCENTMFTGVEV